MAIIGTMRPEEARVFDSQAGYHQFHAGISDARAEPFGSFEVYWIDSSDFEEDDTDPMRPGWYWVACFPGCMPDGEPCGPFATSYKARMDADETGWEYGIF